MAQNPFSDPDYGADSAANTGKPANPFNDPEYGKEPTLSARVKQGFRRAVDSARTALTDDPNKIASIAVEQARTALPQTALQRGMAQEMAPYVDAANKAEGVTDTVKTWGAAGFKRAGQLLSNPSEAGKMIAEQLPNSLPGLAGGVAGAKLGAMAGTAVAPGLGTVVGGVLGGIAGGFAGGYGLEKGASMQEQVQKEAQAQKIDLQDEAAVARMVAQKQPEFDAAAQRKGVGTAGTDAVLNVATMGLAGLGGRSLAKEARTLADAVKAGTVSAADAGTTLARLEAADAARNTLKAKALRGAGVVGAEMGGEGFSEGVGQKLAYGSVDAGEVIDESLMGLGTGGAMALGSKAFNKAAGIVDQDGTTRNIAAARDGLDALGPAFTTDPGATDPNAPREPDAQAPEAPDLTTTAGAGVPRDGVPFTRDVDTSGLALEDPAAIERAQAATVDYQPGDTTPQWDTQPGAAPVRRGLDMPAPEFDTGALGFDARPLSEQMGIDRTAGPLSAAAATAVDTGATPVQFLGATGRALQTRQTGPGVTNESNVIDVQGRVVDELGGNRAISNSGPAISLLGGAMGNDAGAGRGTASADGQSGGRRITGNSGTSGEGRTEPGSAQPRGRENRNPALTGPSTLREGLERIRAQRQEAANLAALNQPHPEGNSNGPASAQTKQSIAQPTQTGGATTAGPAATTTAGQSATVGGSGVQAAGVAGGVTDQNAGAQGSPAASPQGAAQGYEFTVIKDLYGKTHRVLTYDLRDPNRKTLRTVTASGKPSMVRVNRENLDPTGEKFAAQAQESAANPLNNTITNNRGGPFASRLAAQRAVTQMGLKDTHEVAEVLGGFVGKKKAVANQSLNTEPAAKTDARPDGWRKSMLKAAPVAKAMGIGTKGKRLAQVVDEIDAADAQRAGVRQDGADLSSGQINRSQPGITAQVMRSLAQQFRDRHAVTQQDTDRTFAGVLEQFATEVEEGKRTPQSVQQAIERYRVLADGPKDQVQTGKVAATHADPGRAPEAATPSVVTDSLKKAARNEDTKPSEMRKWLVAEIDKELLQAADRPDYDEAVKRMGEKDAISMFTGNGPLGKNNETGYITFDVPGDGKYKVRNSVRGLLEFRKNVMASQGFKDSGQKRVKPEQNDGVQGGSGGQMAAIANMIEEGDFEAARDYAEAVGIARLFVSRTPKNRDVLYAEQDGKLREVTSVSAEQKAQWDQFLKTGKVPEQRRASREWTITNERNQNGTWSKVGVLKRMADGIEYVATVRGDLDGTNAKYVMVKDGKETGRMTSTQPFSRALEMAEDAMPEANDKPAPSKANDTGWNMAGTGYGGKRYIGRNITTADGREIVARVYENAGNYEEAEVKVDGVRKFAVTDRNNAQDKADAFVRTVTGKAAESASSDMTPEEAAKYLKDFVYSLNQLDGMTDRAQVLLSSPLGKSGRDNLLMEAFGLNREQAHDINNRIDARQPKKLRNIDMQDAFDVFPSLRKMVYDAIQQDQAKEQKTPPKAPAIPAGRTYLAVPFNEKDYAKRAGAKWDEGRKLWYADPVGGDGAAAGEININLQQYVPRDYTKDDRYNYYGDKALATAVALNAGARDGVQYETVKRKHPDGMMMWSVVKAGEQTQAAPAAQPAIPKGYKPAGEPFYRGGKQIQGYAPFTIGERVTMKDSAGQSGVIESLASPDDSGVFASAVVKFDNGMERMVQFGKLEASAAQPITRADVTAAQQQAAAIITERIDAMTAGEVNTIARRFLPTMGVKPTVSKERNKAAVTDFTKVNPIAAADEFGVTLPADVRRALDAEMQGNVADGFVEPAAATVSPQEGIAQAQANAARFEIGKSLTKEQRKQVLNSLVDVYKSKGAEREFKGQDGNGNDRYGYAHSPDLFEKSDITGAMVRYYVTLPDGRIAHPTELFPDVSASDIERMALEQEANSKSEKAFENAIKPFYQDFDSANLMAVTGQAVISKGDRFAIIPDRIGSVNQARQQGWELAKAAAPVATPAPAAPAAPITDFGEKLEGARKDMPPSLKEEVSDEKIASLPLSKIWPSDAHESIEDDAAAALVFAARQEIPAKPRVPSRVRAWVSKVKAYRTLVKDLGKNSLDRIEQLSKEKGFHSLDPFFAKVRLLSQLPRDTWSRVERVEEYPNAIRYEKDGSKTAVAFSSVTIDGKSRRFDGVGKIGPDEVQAVKEMLGTAAPKKDGLTAQDFEVRGTAKTGYKINRKGDSEYRSLKIFTGEDAAKQALAWRDENTAELEAAWEAVKARDNVSKAEVRRNENRERTGENRRNGRDVTAEMFTDAFGFRGGQFGNWVGQGADAKSRQGMLNDAYDALLDLSDILGIPSRAISLNGTLGLSFGARGSGKAAAHFEPSNLVINLTKTRGAGSLAHEWFHALDNYFSRMRGGEVAFTGDNNAYRQNNFVTYKPEAAWGKAPITPYTNFMRGGQLRERLQRLPGFTYDANKTLAENAKAAGFERDPSHKEGVRPQVEKAFADLVQALNDSPMAKRASSLDKAADGYWGRIIERGARSFENYVISKMAQRGWSNDFLANIRSFDEWMAMGKNAERYPYLKPEEDAPVVAAFDKLAATIKTKETEKGVAMFSRAPAAFSFAGQQAVTADQHALATAQQRLEVGEDAETVRQETGWFQGKDGKWRFEISDAGAQLAQQVYFAERGKWYPSRFLADARDHGSDTGGTGTLGDVLEHPALFAAYPALRDMPVTAKIRKDQESGAFDGRFITATAENEGRLLSVLLHEIQHGIQNIEGFATGGTPKNMAGILDKKSLEEMARVDDLLTAEFDALKSKWSGVSAEEMPANVIERATALRREINAVRNTGHRQISNPFARPTYTDAELHDGYRRLAGEVEARNTQARQGMTDEQRRATAPGQTADVADADVIVVFNGKEMANAPMPANAAPDAATTAQPLRTPAATIRAAITKAYGKLLGQLESKGLVTLTQTQEQAIEAAAQARAAKTGQSVEQARATLRASVKNSVADQTQTENFQRWFKDSKVVDAEGKPLVVYRGDRSGATVLSIEKTRERGIFTTDDEDVAKVYANGGQPMALYIRGENVLDLSKDTTAARKWIYEWSKSFDDWTDRQSGEEIDPVDAVQGGQLFDYEGDWSSERWKDLQASAKADGFDVLIAPDFDSAKGVFKSYIALHGDAQLKSATGNRGTFDPADPDIRRSADGSIQGFFDPQTGQSFLVADNLTAEAAPGVLMHEVGIHMAADGSMKALFNRAAMMLKLQMGNPFIKAVQARMDAAGETSGEEAAAYIAEAYENDRANAPASVQRWLADLLAAVKAWMFKKGIMGADRLTVADIAAVARANARSMARDGGATGGQGFGPAFSHAPAGDQTQTEAFKRWFGDSKVVDADGKPLVVYHGAAEGFTSFDERKIGSRDPGFFGAGFYFTPDATEAQDYADSATEADGEGDATTIPAFVSIQNPFVWDMEAGDGAKATRQALLAMGIERSSVRGNSAALSNQDERRKFAAAMKAAGHDGVIVRDEDGIREIVAFRSTQIKSATGNNGSFDPTNPDIRFSRTSTTGVAARMGDAIKSVTVQNVKDKASYKKADWLGLGLQTLGRRQIVDIYGDLLPLAEYNRLVQQMEADKNEGGAEADQLVTRWAKLSDETKLADLMHDATLAQIDPDKPYADGDDKAVYMMLQGRFKTLSDDAKAVYRATRDAYRAHHAKVRSAIKDRIERSEIKGERKAALLKQMDDEFFKAIKGVYFPLARFGQYAVTVKGPDGKVESVSRAETKAEAEALRNNLLAAFPREKGFTVGRVMLSKDFIADRDAVGRGFMTELYQVLDKQDMDAAQRAELEDTLGQLYLSSLPDLSWAKHGIHRKGTPGFSQDARRAYAQNMFHGARYLAKLRYSDLMQDELTTMQKHVDDWREVDDFDQNSAQRVVDEMNKRHESLMNPKSNALSTALTSLGFVFHLGLSPASAMVNLSQTALVAYPIMGAKWGFSKASAALLKASKQAAAGKNDITGSLNADERAAYDEAVRAGTIDVTMAHDLAGIAQGEDAGVMWKIRPVMRWASFLFHHAERFNRQVTFVAAYRLARDAGADHKAAFEQATKATYDGHFDYGAANRPRIMQGNVAKVLLLFKQYGQNMVYTLSRNAYQSIKGTDAEKAEARKALAGLLTSHAMAAGVLGLPMVTTLLAAASMLGGDDDEPWDAKVALQNMLADAFGQKPAEVLAHGLSRLTPWDISGRVGLDRLILPDVQEGLEGQRLAESAMTAALGPVAGIGVNVLRGVQDMSNGQFARGLEGMLPAALRNGAKAIRYANEGAQDKSGIVIKDEVNPAEVIGQALGFSPSSVRNASEGKSAVLDFDRELTRRRGHLLTEFANARREGDAEAVKEAQADIAKFNEKNPGRRITVPQMMASVRARQMRIDQAKDGIYLPKNRTDARDAGRFAIEQ